MAKQIPHRQCVGCKEMKPKNELVRVIKTPTDTVELDLTGKKNGRGAYICHSISCYNKAVKSRAIERTLKLTIPEEVYEQIGKEMS